VPEASIQPLDALSRDTLVLLRHHGLLRTLVSRLVTDALLEPVELDETTRQQAMQAYRQRNGLSTNEQLQDHCRKNGYGPAELSRQAQLPVQIRKTSQKRFGKKAELHYLTRKEQFDLITFSQLSVSNSFLAQELFLRLKEGEAGFQDLAEELNQNNERKGQVTIGPVPMSRLPAELSKPLRAASPGAVLEPIKVQNSWRIVRLEQFQPTQYDEAMEQRMCLELFQQDLDRLVDERIDTMTHDLFTEMNPLSA